MVAQHASHQFLIVAKAIDVGRVEESFASVDGVVNQVTRSSIIAGTIELGHAHAAQADGADGQTIGTCLTDRKRIQRAWGASVMRWNAVVVTHVVFPLLDASLPRLMGEQRGIGNAMKVASSNASRPIPFC